MQLEKVSQRSLSNQTGLQRKSIKNWLDAKFYPRYDALIKLSDFFYVSADYMIGKSNDASKIKNFSKDNSVSIPLHLTSLLSDYLVETKLSKYMLAKKLKIGQSTLSRWFDGKSMPETAVLIRLADLMGESLDYLLGRE